MGFGYLARHCKPSSGTYEVTFDTLLPLIAPENNHKSVTCDNTYYK